MSHHELPNWAYSKVRVQITQDAISLVAKKHSDLICNTDSELSAKRPTVAHNLKLNEDLSTWVLQYQTWNVFLIKEVIEVKALMFIERLILPEDTIKFSRK